MTATGRCARWSRTRRDHRRHAGLARRDSLAALRASRRRSARRWRTAQFPAVRRARARYPPPAGSVPRCCTITGGSNASTLRDVTDEADKFAGAGDRPAGQLAARWQVPRARRGRTDVSELLLFSTAPDLWINRLADGGAGLRRRSAARRPRTFASDRAGPRVRLGDRLPGGSETAPGSGCRPNRSAPTRGLAGSRRGCTISG